MGRYDLGKAVVKTNDFVSVVNWTWEDDKLTTSCYSQTTMECIEKIREITTDAFAEQVLFLWFRPLHMLCVARETNLVRAEVRNCYCLVIFSM